MEDKKTDPMDLFEVIDRTAGPAGNVHDFFDPSKRIQQFEFKKGIPTKVPRYVAEKCGEINRASPDNPPFIISSSEGMTIDAGAFEEAPLDKLIAEIRMSLPKQADALQKKLDVFATSVEGQLVHHRTEAATKDVRIEELEAELKAAKAGGSSTGADPLAEGHVVAKLEELMGDALKQRASALPGFDKLGGSPNKGVLIDFLTDHLWPAKKGDNSIV